MPYLASKCYISISNVAFLAGKSLLGTRFLHKGSLKYPLRDNLLKVKRGSCQSVGCSAPSLLNCFSLVAVSLYIFVIRGR